MKGHTTSAQVYCGVMVAVAMVTGVYAASLAPPPYTAGSGWAAMLVLLPLMILGEAGAISALPGRRRSAATYEQSFTAGLHVAAVILLGPALAALAVGLAVLVAELLRHAGWFKALFNVSLLVVVVMWSGLLYELVRAELVETQGSLTFPADYMSVAVLIVAYALLNDALLSPMLAYANGADVGETFTGLASEAWLVTFSEGAVGVLTAYIYETEPWVLPLVLPPLVAVMIAYRNYVAARLETENALVAMADVVESRDPYTADHSLRVAEYAVRLGKGIGLSEPELHSLDLAGRLHDLGKIGVDNAVLLKPGALTPEEYARIQQHPELSGRILTPFDFARTETQYIHLHHERIDGRGYPFGLLGEEIPLAARILSIADAFDAMTTDRPYRRAMSRERALQILRENAGSQFDERLVETFCRLYLAEGKTTQEPSARPALANAGQAG